MQRLADWTAMMLGAAEGTALQIGCSPEAIVAQAALESAWGAASIGNNVFGIKADPSWTGPRRSVWTREVLNGESVMIEDWFRDYPSVQASIEDHFRFLRDNDRYRRAGVFDAKSDLQYFEALQRAGYATDPAYAERLMDVLRTVLRFSADAVLADEERKPSTAPRLLMVGCVGPDVAALQRKLGLSETGAFDGALTRQIIAYQRDHELAPDGIVGPRTRASLGL
ncbi:MAG: glucosaminidase domain-containing protein [Proteobacteria bacterium]|nr:glucosaminidase domain-containing protein [Pseudomonadota bacterium]